MSHFSLNFHKSRRISAQSPVNFVMFFSSCSRRNPFGLKVALDQLDGDASGSLFWDDGDAIGNIILTFNKIMNNASNPDHNKTIYDPLPLL